MFTRDLMLFGTFGIHPSDFLCPTCTEQRQPYLLRMADTEQVVLEHPCAHSRAAVIHEIHRPAAGCEECLKMGSRWVHLRECLTCGHIGCCDSSPNRHATAHYHGTHHPIMTSAERGEHWVWCYPDEAMLAS